MDITVLNSMSASDLWYLKDTLHEGCELLDKMIKRNFKRRDVERIKTDQGRMFYMMGNLTMVEEVFLAKTQNIFDSTEFSEICFN